MAKQLLGKEVTAALNERIKGVIPVVHGTTGKDPKLNFSGIMN